MPCWPKGATAATCSEARPAARGAADTFRAAAAEQLSTWGERVGVDVVRSEKEGAAPASVAYDAAREAAAQEADVVVVDTAGRLQNKAGLMDELGKIKRVMEKIAAGLRERGIVVEEGRFGAMMSVTSVNEGPVTLLVEC